MRECIACSLVNWTAPETKPLLPDHWELDVKSTHNCGNQVWGEVCGNWCRERRRRLGVAMIAAADLCC